MYHQFNACHFFAVTPNMSPSNRVQIWFHFNPISKPTFIYMSCTLVVRYQNVMMIA